MPYMIDSKEVPSTPRFIQIMGSGGPGEGYSRGDIYGLTEDGGVYRYETEQIFGTDHESSVVVRYRHRWVACNNHDRVLQRERR